MAEQQPGSTNNWQVTWLPDGSILITTEDEMSATDVLEFAADFEDAASATIPVMQYYYNKRRAV